MTAQHRVLLATGALIAASVVQLTSLRAALQMAQGPSTDDGDRRELLTIAVHQGHRGVMPRVAPSEVAAP